MCFCFDGKQSINYRAGTWHHPLLTFEAPSDFAVVDQLEAVQIVMFFNFQKL
jgi:ureidoglycolate hydrolase